MTRAEITETLARIAHADTMRDHEVAHSLEDELLWSFIFALHNDELKGDQVAATGLLVDYYRNKRGERYCA